MSPIDFCDLQHQPIAFLGTCPICRVRRYGKDAPLHTDRSPYWSDLDAALRAHYRGEVLALSRAFVEGGRRGQTT